MKNKKQQKHVLVIQCSTLYCSTVKWTVYKKRIDLKHWKGNMILFLILALILPILSKAMTVSIPGLGSIKGTSSKSEKGLDFYKFLGRVCQIERVCWLWRVYYVLHLYKLIPNT